MKRNELKRSSEFVKALPYVLIALVLSVIVTIAINI